MRSPCFGAVLAIRVSALSTTDLRATNHLVTLIEVMVVRYGD